MPAGSEAGAVLIVAPTGKDARLAAEVLARQGQYSHSCQSLLEVVERLDDSSDAILVAQEAIVPDELLVLVDALNAQPPWSDIPVIILASSGSSEEMSQQAVDLFGPGANVTLLERPLHMATLVTTVLGAARARGRQREVRDLLTQRDAILTSISDAFSALDRDWRYTYVNDRVVELAGIPREKIIGRVIWEIFPEAIDGEFYQRAQQAMAAQQPDRFTTFYKPWGRWLETRIYPSGDGLVVYRADVTEMIEQEERLRDNEQRLQIARERIRLAVEAADVGIFDYYPQTQQLRWSERCNELFGLPRAAKPGYEMYLAGIHPLDRHLVKEITERVLAPASPQTYEIEYRTVGLEDGRERWVAEKGRVMLDEQGRAHRFLGTLLDMTERKRAENERRQAEQTIRASEAQLRFVTDHASSILLAQVDRETRFLFVNQPYAARFGRRRNEIVGKTMRELLGDAAFAVLEPHVRSVLDGQRIEFEIEIPYQSGARWMSCTYVPEQSDDGKVRSFVAVVQDVTGRKTAERTLQLAKQEAEEANQAKDQFLAMLSHELRTPLTPVLMTISSLQEDKALPPHVRQDIDVLRRNVELEALLIDDLLDLTRIVHGKLELRQGSVDIHTSLIHALDISANELKEKHIRVTRDFAASTFCVWGDGARLQQVFWNIIKNAVKFTPAGGELRVSTCNDAEGQITVAFADTGAGISSELQARIFDAFEQGGRGVTKRYGGLGLGLAICKRVIDLHGGHISVASPGPGQGATFSVTLATKERSLCQQAASPVASRPAQSTSADILLVEDHHDTAQVMLRMLQGAGYHVTLASSLAQARELAGARHFQVLISDLGLPDGSGAELMQELRASGGIVGIALSGYGMENDIAAARAAGFAEHFTKPVDWDRLHHAIVRLLTERAAAPSLAPSSPSG